MTTVARQLRLFPDDDSGKSCSHCHRTLPLTEFYVSNKQTGKLYPHCKSCHLAYPREQRKRDPEHVRAQGRAKYQRNRDKIVEWKRQYRASPEGKAAIAAYEDSHAEEKRAYRKKNSARIVARVKRWQEENRERHNAGYRRRYAENLDRERARAKKYREETRDTYNARQQKYRANNREKCNQRIENWRQRNRDKSRAYVRNRQARIAGAEGSFTGEEWREVKKQQDYRCLWCGHQEPDIKLTIDHIVPLCEGGSNYIRNIQGLCGPCNSKKGRRVIAT